MKSKYIYPETHVIETIADNAFMLDFSGDTSGGDLPHIGDNLHPGAPIRRIGGLGSLGKVGSVK